MSVATQTITVTDLRTYAVTRDNVLDGVADHVFSHDPLTAIFLGKSLGDFGGNQMAGAGKSNQTGGASVQVRVRLGKHSGFKWMAGAYDTHSVTPDDNLRLAQANWIHASGALVLSDTDKLTHVGDENMIPFVADQTESVMLAAVDEIGDALQATANPANSITSLDTLISANDSVQTLDGAVYAGYNSRGVTARGTAAASVSFATGSFVAQGIADWRTAFNNASEGNITPTVIACGYDTHERFEGALQPQERYAAPAAVGDPTFQSLAFRTKPVLASSKTPSGHVYFLRPGSDGVQIVNLSGTSFVFAPFKPGAAQETHVSELQWKGQFVLINRGYGQNKLTGTTD